MTFATAEEMHAHLAAAITDEAQIVHLVRRRFPEYRSAVRDKVPSRFDPWVVSDGNYRGEADIRAGSEKLLAALWREHYPILRGWERAGKWVVRPKGKASA